MKQTAGDALRQAFMPKEEYEGLRDEERVWNRLAKPLLMSAVATVGTAVIISFFVMADIVFAVTGQDWPFCENKKFNALSFVPGPAAAFNDGDSRASYLLTEEEAARYFWIVIFLPTSIVLITSLVYLFAGISVAYSAPNRHPCLKVVENNCCASRYGGVRCLAIVNSSLFVVFALLALFLGSSILTLETDCSNALFWCYEVVCWGTAFLLAGNVFYLRRKAAVIMDAGLHYGSRTVGVELLEAAPIERDYLMERRIRDGFKAWAGALDSDDDEEEEDGDDDEEVGHHQHRQQSRVGLDDIWEEDKETYAAPIDIGYRRTG